MGFRTQVERSPQTQNLGCTFQRQKYEHITANKLAAFQDDTMVPTGTAVRFNRGSRGALERAPHSMVGLQGAIQLIRCPIDNAIEHYIRASGITTQEKQVEVRHSHAPPRFPSPSDTCTVDL